MNRTIKSGDAKYNLLQNRMIQYLVADNSKDVNFFPTPAAFRQNYVAEFEGISGDSFGNQFRRIKQHIASNPDMVALDEGQVEITQNGSNARNLLENSGFPPVPRALAPTRLCWICSGVNRLTLLCEHVPIEQSLFTMFATMFVSVEIRETVPKHVQTRYFQERVAWKFATPPSTQDPPSI
eukprot:scaffold1621_cov262-Chaetoceros_neogracile.AAC.1